MKKNVKVNLPKGYSYFESIFRSFKFLTNPIGFISLSMEKFSDTYSVKLFNRKTLILTQDSDFIEHVLRKNHTNYEKSEISSVRAAEFFGKGLLFSNGSEHLRQRRLIQPGFQKKKFDELFGIIKKSINDFLTNFPTGEKVDVCPLMYQLTFDVVINSLFNVDISKNEITTVREAFDEIQQFLFRENNNPFQKLFYLINSKEKKAIENAKAIRDVISNIIEERMADNKEHSDLLDMLINSRYEDTGEAMLKDQIIDEAIILILAGHETTASTLSWMLYLLSENPKEIEELLMRIESKDIDSIIRDDYFSAVINESMRLYPPAWITERVALNQDQLKEFSFSSGTIIIPFFYGLHRNEKYWKNPLKFSPKRFLEKDSKKIKAFFPFGSGPRMCIGNNFAIAEISFFLYEFLKKYKIEHINYTPKAKTLLTLKPSHVFLKIKNR